MLFQVSLSSMVRIPAASGSSRIAREANFRVRASNSDAAEYLDGLHVTDETLKRCWTLKQRAEVTVTVSDDWMQAHRLEDVVNLALEQVAA